MLQLLAAVSHVYQNHSFVCFRGSLCMDSESGTYAGPPAPWLGTGQVAEMALTELQDQERVCRGSSQFIVRGEILAGLSNGSVKLRSMQQLLISDNPMSCKHGCYYYRVLPATGTVYETNNIASLPENGKDVNVRGAWECLSWKAFKNRQIFSSFWKGTAQICKRQTILRLR